MTAQQKYHSEEFGNGPGPENNEELLLLLMPEAAYTKDAALGYEWERPQCPVVPFDSPHATREEAMDSVRLAKLSTKNAEHSLSFAASQRRLRIAKYELFLFDRSEALKDLIESKPRP